MIHKRSVMYNVKFMVPGLDSQIFSKQISNYKKALKEAEGWVLSGKGYTCIVEWETFTGNKSLVLNFAAVQQQRKARQAYKKAVKENLFRNTYVDV